MQFRITHTHVDVGMLNGHSDSKYKSHMVFHSPQFFSVFYAETDICNCAFSYLVSYVPMCESVQWEEGDEEEQCVCVCVFEMAERI